MSHTSANISRRATILALALHPAAWAAKPSRPSEIRFYTKETAPDEASKRILSKYLRKLEQGTPPGTSPAIAIHRNFPAIIEQNIASMSLARLKHWLSTVSSEELRSLGSLYALTVSDSGHRAELFNIFARRLDGRTVGKLSPHFGFPQIYNAILQSAPEKTQDFLRTANPSHLVSTSARSGISTSAGLDLTLHEIYLNFRTAPVGSLSVRAAIYETTAYAGKHLAVAWGVGYTVGTGLSWVIQNYYPALGDFIGSSIYNFVESIHTAPSAYDLGDALYHGASIFDLDPFSYDALAYAGGDYGITYEWAQNNGGDCSRMYWAICNYF